MISVPFKGTLIHCILKFIFHSFLTDAIQTIADLRNSRSSLTHSVRVRTVAWKYAIIRKVNGQENIEEEIEFDLKF